MIKVRSLKKIYDGVTVLNIDHLDIEEGKTIALIGPNGCGKSTFLKIFSKVIKATQGEIQYDGSVLYLPQQSLAFSKTVIKNILYGAKADKKNALMRADMLIEKTGLTALKDKKANKLSGGELQKTAICRLLINDCDYLLLDEPTSATDIESAQSIRNLVSDYKKETGCTVIMTTHSPAEAKEMADTIIMLHDGEIAEVGTPEKLFENPSTDWGKKFIGQWKI
ncbi:MAG: ABC transporter ATP-binding protein [Clostridia bacterium]|nr:ABC transporter ATP-binding protein [Clostridia bacterium]